ncbi:MAG TPA: hypothetical protein VMW64_03390, partial [Dehalococcoidia bacterium]|nr:hypothetical protein [Dehalococcoidia bacterium]
GTAPSSMSIAPYASEDWEIWACSPGTMGVPRVDVLFELHRYVQGTPSFPADYVAYLKAFKGTVWMTEQQDDIPGCEELPYKELVEKYGPYFFTSSIAWMMAMAIEMGADHIALWGVDMAAQTEYMDQKMGCQYFATLAKAQGIQIGVPPESDLFRPQPLYGVCQSQHSWIKNQTKRVEYEERIRQAESIVAAHSDEIQFLRGAKEDLDYHQKTWFGQDESNYTAPPIVPALEK